MAAVCPINDPAIAQVGLFNAPGSSGDQILGGLVCEPTSRSSTSNADGGVVADPVANFSADPVRENSHRELSTSDARFRSRRSLFTTPGFATTLRRESLGVPRDGVIRAVLTARCKDCDDLEIKVLVGQPVEAGARASLYAKLARETATSCTRGTSRTATPIRCTACARSPTSSS